MIKLLTSERLYIRQLADGDAAFILKLVNTPGWLAYIGDRDIKTEETALAYIEQQQKGYKSFSFGLSAVCLLENNQAIGLCGFLKREALPHRDIGYALLPDFARKGYTSEAVKAALKWYWKEYPNEPVLAQVQEDNQPSIGLLKKLRFERKNIPTSDSKTLLFRRDPN